VTDPTRRKLILGAAATLIVAPAIVRPASLMKVKPIAVPIPTTEDYDWPAPQPEYVMFCGSLYWIDAEGRLKCYNPSRGEFEIVEIVVTEWP